MNDVFQKQYNKLFIGGVSTEITEEILFNCFSKFGEVEKIYLIYDKVTGQSKGFGFLEYNDLEVAKKVAEAHYIILNNCRIEIKPKLLKRDAQLANNSNLVINTNDFYKNLQSSQTKDDLDSKTSPQPNSASKNVDLCISDIANMNSSKIEENPTVNQGNFKDTSAQNVNDMSKSCNLQKNNLNSDESTNCESNVDISTYLIHKSSEEFPINSVDETPYDKQKYFDFSNTKSQGLKDNQDEIKNYQVS